MRKLYNSIEGCVGKPSIAVLNERAQALVDRWHEKADTHVIYCRTPQEGRAFLRLMRGFIKWRAHNEADEYDPWERLDEDHNCLFFNRGGLTAGTLSEANEEGMLVVPVEKVLDYLYGRS